MKIQKNLPLSIFAILALGSLSGCLKPRAVPAVPAVPAVLTTDKGYKLSSHCIGVSPSAFIQALKQNGFETIEGKTFEQFVPDKDLSRSRGFVGIVALRDTTVKEPNEFIVGVGSDTVTLLELKSYTVSNDHFKGYYDHINRRIDLVKKLGDCNCCCQSKLAADKKW